MGMEGVLPPGGVGGKTAGRKSLQGPLLARSAGGPVKPSEFPMAAAGTTLIDRLGSLTPTHWAPRLGGPGRDGET